MRDDSHLNAIRLRLSNERARLASARTENDCKFRLAQVASAEKELAGELAFLDKTDEIDAMSDDELLEALRD